MKKTLLTIFSFAACLSSLQAQILYCTTPGGTDRGGTINRLNAATGNMDVFTPFESIGANPNGSLVKADDGKFYGMTTDGGNFGNGVIFSFDASASIYTRLMDFNDTNGAHPNGRLIQASDGKLYGLTTDGGANGKGVIFSFDPTSSGYTRLLDFDINNGANPKGSLMEASDGKLYGMTTRGGSTGGGVIFSIDPATSAFKKLYDFAYDFSQDNTGAGPFGSLVQTGDGKLYGLTAGGGSSFIGVLFSFDPSISVYTKLVDFVYSNGAHSYGSLVLASDGKLYGMTLGGGSSGVGIIFSFEPSSAAFTKLKDFDGGDGGWPVSSLMQARDGKLYGMTNFGGSSGEGVIFSYDPASSFYTKLQDFDGINGANPAGELVEGNDGKLYGMAHGVGQSSIRGVIFSFDPAASSYKKLKEFNFPNGRNPSGTLVQASNGNLYGMTTSGGDKGFGVIFSFNPSTFIYENVFDLDSTNGGNPASSLIQAKDGKLYGMTPAGGNSNSGVIFSFDAATGFYKKLKDFGGSDGTVPLGSLMQASDGKLYGMTLGGGKNNVGVVFSFDPVTSTYKKHVDFDGSNGANPYGNLEQANDGKLYGMTLIGGVHDYRDVGAGVGVIFSFDPSTSVLTKVKDFDLVRGGYPQGSLELAIDGKLYGMALPLPDGYPYGFIFSFDPSTSVYSPFRELEQWEGVYPTCNFLQASNGILYGLMPSGGPFNQGLIFSLDPATYEFTDLADFNGMNGGRPRGNSTVVEVDELFAVQAVRSFTLVDANTGQDIQVIRDKSILDKVALPANLNIRANTTPHKVGSVVFILDGQKLRTENGAPYALAGDLPSGNYHPWSLPLGDHTLTAIPYSDYNGQGTEGAALTIHFTVLGPRVENFTLVDANTDKDILPIFDGKILNKCYLPSNLNIRANTAPDKVGSVVFILDGQKVRTENGVPYALAGDSPSGDYHAWSLPLGDHTLTAIPYSKYNGIGREGGSLTIHFTVVYEPNIIYLKPFRITDQMKLTAPEEEMQFTLYPNPVKDFLTVSLKGPQLNKMKTISILTISGATIKTIHPVTQNKTIQLNVSSMVTGTYILKIINDHKVNYKKFVKL